MANLLALDQSSRTTGFTVLKNGKIIRNHFKQLEKYHNSKNKGEQIDFNNLYANIIQYCKKTS